MEKDEGWDSPCEKGEFNEDFMLWQPQKVVDELSFKNVEDALGITLHEDIQTYYTTMYSELISVTCDEGNLCLLSPWSEKDFSRLQENIIGHILMKQKLKQEITVFFAITDEEDHVLTIKNSSGEVWVERVGCEPHKKLADTIEQFLSQLSPHVE